MARGSKEFDSYLMGLLQGVDGEIAVRDQWRDDYFHAGITPSSSMLDQPRRVRPSNYQLEEDLRSYDSGENISGEDGTGDDDDDDDDDISDDSAKVKLKVTASNKAGKGRAGKQIDPEQLEEFLKFQAMFKGKGR